LFPRVHMQTNRNVDFHLDKSNGCKQKLLSSCL